MITKRTAQTKQQLNQNKAATLSANFNSCGTEYKRTTLTQPKTLLNPQYINNFNHNIHTKNRTHPTRKRYNM